MRKPALRVTCALSALLVVAIAAYATVARYTVTATIYNGGCTSINGSNNCTLSSDGNGYAVYKTGSGVTSTLTPDSTGAGTLYDQWNLSLGNSARSFYLTLIPVGTSPNPPFSGPLAFKGTLYSRCFTDGSAGTVQNWTLILGSDPYCGMRVLFTYAGINYTLVMSPEQAASGQPATGAAAVSCTSGTSPCTSWTDVPTSGITNANVANLYNGGSAPIGQYDLTFNVVLTHP